MNTDEMIRGGWDAAEAAGMTYRQLDQLITKGCFTPTVPALGSGVPALYSGLDVQILAFLRFLLPLLPRVRVPSPKVEGLDSQTRRPIERADVIDGHEIVRRVVAQLRDDPDLLEHDCMFVTADGEIRSAHEPPLYCGWMVVKP